MAAAGPARRWASEPETTASAPLVVRVFLHVFAGSEEKLLSQETLDEQMAVLNRSYASVNVSFAVAEQERAVDELWAESSYLDMMWNRSEGRADGQALHLYFVDRFGGRDSALFGLGTFPNLMDEDASRVRTDGVVVVASTAPGAAPGQAGKAAVHAVGHWFGLLETGSKDCGSDGDGVADTPVALRNASFGCPVGLDSCPGQPGLDPIRNFMSTTDDSCRDEFTPGQGRRLHELWQRYRSRPRTLPDPILAPIKPITKPDKRPFYPNSETPLAALLLCSKDPRTDVIRETRENRCGSFNFCYFGAAEATGQAGKNWFYDCAEARADPLLEKLEAEEKAAKKAAEKAAKKAEAAEAEELDDWADDETDDWADRETEDMEAEE
ncbi:hypothetical protein CDD83_2376 [Cordyceps sp. RAO-2017]|nr:hypothetical protein CDD83_2376 [Cordyceps sp. RAO-2017]